ncbi:MAG: branched-chain amino acid ABC transporter permease [Burkholderiaceae bacterium]|jgi:branched-chain amino acid transport system permease protein|nr:branched-chain amino acid ABC transporter permease [Burkholderiaceae bacterium]
MFLNPLRWRAIGGGRKPLPRAAALAWAAWALVLLAAPWVWRSSLGINLLGQMGIAIIACLSYNILYGQGGMLSFGHAALTGLGAYGAIHALNAAARGALPVPVALIPLAGALAGALTAAIWGYVATRRAGTAFAMITLGIGELLFAAALMFTGFFGGEAGIAANRVLPPAWLGITWGPHRQMYYLIALYTFLSMALMYAFTRTPLGRALNAVRDNPERAAFVGFDSRRVRYGAFVVSGFFAGIAGGLAALLFELVTPEALSAARSGEYLLFTLLGGSGVFWGPALGGVLLVLATMVLAGWTSAWLLYMGLAFIVMVMYAPAGLAGWLQTLAALWRQGHLARLAPRLLCALAGAGVAFLGAAAMIEMGYSLEQATAPDGETRFLGLTLLADRPASWLASLGLLCAGATWFVWARRAVLRAWQALPQTPARPAQNARQDRQP